MIHLNDYTKEELVQLLAKAQVGKERVCPYCEKAFKVQRAGQVFCAKEHQKLWHKEATSRLEKRIAQLEQTLAAERATWAAEREGLVRELAKWRRKTSE